LFTLLDKSDTGVEFRNMLVEGDELNVMNYSYFYNGSGVSVVDINNDGLLDLFFTGNMVKNKLYLNKGDFKFEDITSKSGISLLNSSANKFTTFDTYLGTLYFTPYWFTPIRFFHCGLPEFQIEAISARLYPLSTNSLTLR
jgi:hypothetical protein